MVGRRRALLIPRARPTYALADLAGAIRAHRDGVERFESELAEHLGLRHAISFPYGRSAIYTTLRALRTARRDVVQPAYNCVGVAHATVKAGYTPLFVDSEADSPNHDFEQMLAVVSMQTAAVFPTSIFGVTFDAATLCAEIRRRNEEALILMDCCQSFDGDFAGRRLIVEGDAALVAFGIGKPMTTLFGGALVTDRDDVARRVREERDRLFSAPSGLASLRTWCYFLGSWVALSGPMVRLTDWLEFSDTLLRRYLLARRTREAIRLPRDNEVHLTAPAAGIGRAQLKRVSSFLNRRCEIARVYAEALGDLPGLDLLDWPPGSSYAIYAARLREPRERNRVLQILRQHGVQGDTVLSYVVPDLDCYRELGYSSDKSPNASSWARSVINLPNHPSMSRTEVNRTVRAVRAAFETSDR